MGDKALSKVGQQDFLVRSISQAETEGWFRGPIVFSEVVVDWLNQCVANDGS